MITESYFFDFELGVTTGSIELPDLNKAEFDLLRSYVEITRHFQELYNLFNIFVFCKMKMHYFYQFDFFDNITPKIKHNFKIDDYIILNSLLIEFISSGKTLYEAFEIFLTEFYKDDHDKKDFFKTNFCSKKYDENFYFRFLLFLRNFAQHGHLIASIDHTGRYYFDLNKILSIPHFHHNASMKSEMEKICENIQNIFLDHPRICLTRSICEFNCCITYLYLNYIMYIKKDVISVCDDIKRLIKSRPELIYKSSDGLNGLVIYKDGDVYHSFNPSENFINTFKSVEKNVRKIYFKENSRLRMEKIKEVFL